MEFFDKFVDQAWYQMAGEITLFMSASAALLPPRWRVKANGKSRSWYKYLYMVVEFTAVNIFHAKSEG